MHHVDTGEFLWRMSGFLGGYYLFLALMNLVAALCVWKTGRSVRLALTWAVLGSFFLVLCPLALSGDPQTMKLVSLPKLVMDLINLAMGPVVYSLGVMVLLVILFVGRRFFVKPAVAWAGLNLLALLMGLSMTDADFANIVAKPDNVAIVGMVYLLGFFTWLSAYKSVINDQRLKQGLGPVEAQDNTKVLVWPDLVYIELICMVAFTALMIVWSIVLKAPLEEPANIVKTPNPSKAPWYFLGLQEMLVYFDPWMAGVVLPGLVLFGLMAIPYLDFSTKGTGYYTIDERKFAYVTFQFGFLVLWVMLIVMGTFMRGPNWNFYSPYEAWDPRKVVALNNVDLSEYFWIDWLGQSRPSAPADSGGLAQLGYILCRESPGIVLLIIYLGALPPALVLCSRLFREMFIKMGFVRYMVMINLLLWMALLPLKMMCRWMFNLKYFISIPEYLTNF